MADKKSRRPMVFILAAVVLLSAALLLIPIWDAQRLMRYLETNSPLATSFDEPDPWPIGAARQVANRVGPYKSYWRWCLERAAENAEPYSPPSKP